MQAQTISTIESPDALKHTHHDVCFLTDVFFVNSVPFVLTMSENIKLRRAKLALCSAANSLIAATQRAIKTCTQNGFDVVFIDADPEFNCIKNKVPVNDSIVPFNVLDKDAKNNPSARSICAAKELARCEIQSLTFDYMSKAIICG